MGHHLAWMTVLSCTFRLVCSVVVRVYRPLLPLTLSGVELPVASSYSSSKTLLLQIADNPHPPCLGLNQADMGSAAREQPVAAPSAQWPPGSSMPSAT